LPERTNRRLAELLAPQIPGRLLASPLAGVEYMRAVVSTPRHPIVYTPRIVIIAQGHSACGWVTRSSCRPRPLLVLSVPMPFECRRRPRRRSPCSAWRSAWTPSSWVSSCSRWATARSPRRTPSVVYVGATAIDEASWTRGAPREALSSPADSKILGPQIVKEIVYRVLTGEQGDVLRLLTAQANRTVRSPAC